MSVARMLTCLFLLGAQVPGGLSAENLSAAESEMAALYLKTEIADRVVLEARKLSVTDETDRKEIDSAADAYRTREIGTVRGALMKLFPDEDTARRRYGDFVNRFVTVSTAEDRTEIIRSRLSAAVDSAGVFLGDLQAWIRLKTNPDRPTLAVWLARNRGAAAIEKPQRKRRTNPLRDAEAGVGRFVEAADDGQGALRSFAAKHKVERDRKLAEAQQGMAQVAAERKVADEEANARKLAAAQAEAAAQQAQAQRIAAAEQEAIVQDQNSWKTRIKGVLSTAIGATAGAFTGGIGTQIGTAAADAVLGNRR